MPALENQQHEIFVQELVKGKGQGEAYLAAGYKAKNVSVASAAATRLLKDVKIQARLLEFQQKAEVETILTLEAHMSELKALRELAKQNGQLSAAITAEVKRGELRKFYIKQIEAGHPGDFKNATNEELEDLIRSEAPEILEQMGILEPPKRGRATKH